MKNISKGNIYILLLIILLINIWAFYSRSKIHELQDRTKLLENKINKIESVTSETYKNNKGIEDKIDELKMSISKLQIDEKKKVSRGLSMRATAYDLTVKSCGKRKSHPEYGITRTGTKATKGRTVAVDPRVIPLRSKLYIKFPEKYKRLDGEYIAEDTGSAVKGDIIDIFLGENEKEVDIFGVQKVSVKIIRSGKL
jgi:3D (Asp-Asp-Asp) domain-containing protein